MTSASMPLTRSGDPSPRLTSAHSTGNVLRTVWAFQRDFEYRIQTVLSANDHLKADLASAPMHVDRLERELEKALADRNEQEEAMLRLIQGSSEQSNEDVLLARCLVGAKHTIRLLEEEVDQLGLMVTPDIGALTSQLTCGQCLGTMWSAMRTIESLGRTLINPVSQSDGIGGRAAEYSYFSAGVISTLLLNSMSSIWMIDYFPNPMFGTFTCESFSFGILSGFRISPIKVLAEGGPPHLDCYIYKIQLGSKSFWSTIQNDESTHFYIILYNNVEGTLRLQLDSSSKLVGGALHGYVVCQVHDYAPSGPTIIPLIDLPLITQNLRAIDLLNMLVDGSVDDVPLNSNNVGCHCWCYQALHLMEKEGIISSDWRLSVGAHVVDEMIDNV
ncbi:hypothetical protein EDD85DRAFT_789745 [Armillaria nabsnona]|nr:hypothetical protein EDD85DRAFT_789745 [Armillaria nabsnona]